MPGHTEHTAVTSRQAAPHADIMPSDHFDNIIVLIPAYNPGPEIVELVQTLKENGCYRFVIVNDGSDHRCNHLFEQLNKIDGVDTRIHKNNQGKGAALRTGLRFIQTMAKGTGVITVDADGQHLPLDVVRLAIQAGHHGNDVILGTRHFSENVPLRSRFGNKLTAFLLNAAYGISLEDTQTGLRYLPPDLLQVIVNLSSDGYEYELECLLAARDSGFTLKQLPIETVYIEGNASSHFRPIIDSYRIYKSLFRFSGSSVFCFGLDISLFSVIFYATKHVMLATMAARTISGVVNFVVNKSYVFDNAESGKAAREGGEYFTLCLVNALLSGGVVSIAQGNPEKSIILIKVLVDIILFFFSYHIQKCYIFADRKRSLTRRDMAKTSNRSLLTRTFDLRSRNSS